jgi:DNA polymerase I-like protein with 3'-5' exonuclease and polymerase domains
MKGEIKFWQWRVDYIQRKIKPTSDVGDSIKYNLKEDLEQIKALIYSEDWIVGQNLRFDAAMLIYLFRDNGIEFSWPWERMHDTLIAGHLLDTASPHNLTSMTRQYIGEDIEKYEEATKKACVSARNIAKRRLPMWLLAKEGLPMMPSAKGSDKRSKKGVESGSPWKFDLALPREIAIALKEPLDHPWHHVTAKYANKDSEVTLLDWVVMERFLKERELWNIYLERMKLPKITFEMEEAGITVSSKNLSDILFKCTLERDSDAKLCYNIASSYKEPDGSPFEFVMPNGASPNESMRTLIFNHMGVIGKKGKKAKTNNPSLDADSLDSYLIDLPKASKPRVFITSLRHKRKRDKVLTDLNGYRKFARPTKESTHFRLHPSFNPTATRTLRWGSYNPNAQNISKKESECKACEGDGCNECNNTGIDFRSLRYCFSPLPNREWWSIDYKNLELRIPAYESQEEEFIKLFERPNDPPYFSSNHALIAHLLFPTIFEKCIDKDGNISGKVFKKDYPQLNTSVKSFNFCIQYGGVDKEDGTGKADRTIGIPGAQARVKSKFAKQEKLNQDCIKFANKHGYIETLPDRSIDPKHGYPIICERGYGNKVVETQPLNYRVQGTGVWLINRAMVKVDKQLKDWRQSGWDGYLISQIHDELLFDFPKSKRHPKEAKESRFRLSTDNLWRVEKIQELMESCGRDLVCSTCPNGIPTPADASYHEFNWSEGIDF